MKLLSIQLHNFRQFYGTTPELVLAASANHNVTIVHGNNGAGKTGLLNAFTWVLYEKFSAAFSSPESLVNKRALAEAEVGAPVECWVELGCEHGTTQYRMRRTCRGYRSETEISQGKSELSLQHAGEDGRWLISDKHLDDVIGRILPVSLHQYFFFDGERIEQIVRSNKKSEIAEATKALLGVEVVTRSIRHLGEARKTLEKELERFGDPETQKLVQKKQTLETELEKLTERQGQIETEIEHHQTLRQEVAHKLREFEAVREVQKRRDDLEAQQQALRDALEQSRVRLKSAISTQGYTVLLTNAIAQFRELDKDLKERDILPAKVKQPFVLELLNRKRCICGTELEEGSEHYHHVESYLAKAGLVDVEESFYYLRNHVDNIVDRQVPKFWETVDGEQQKMGDVRQTLSGIETALDNIRDQLRSSPSEDIRNLEKRHEEIDGKIQSLNREQGETSQKIKDREKQVEELRRQIEKHQATEERQAQTQRRVAATEQAIARLKQVQENVDLVFRADLERRVQEIFQRIVVVPYLPRLTEKYELNLIEKTTGQERAVPASTGENQVLSLSFIGAIIDRVRDWSRKDRQSQWLMPPDAGNYPMVMDSPFGSLDETYRRQVARSLPSLANQLVVLVSKTQWRGEVAQEMHDYIGRQYVLVYHSPKQDVESDFVDLEEGRYPLVKPSSSDFEWTEIIEVE